jgi:hypothetical protein
MELAHLRRTIQALEGDSIGLSEKYLHLVDENNDLEELINRDLVEEFCELDDKFTRLQEREARLLLQEERLLIKLKEQKRSCRSCPDLTSKG